MIKYRRKNSDSKYICDALVVTDSAVARDNAVLSTESYEEIDISGLFEATLEKLSLYDDLNSLILSDSLLVYYYGLDKYLFNNENDYILWKLKYGL